LEAASHIRAMTEPKNKIPIIAMTANAVVGDRERFLEAGMSGYLSKPIRKSDILAAVIEFEAGVPQLLESFLKVVPNTLPLIEHFELKKLANELGADILPVVLRQFIAEVELRCPMANQAFISRDFEGVRKATHALSGICATVGAQNLRCKAEAIEIGCGAMNEAVLASHLCQLSEVASKTIAAFKLENSILCGCS